MLKTREQLENIAKTMRKDIFLMAYNSGQKGAHLGGSMSSVEILVVLYGSIMNYKASDGSWAGRDRFVMSKAHSAIGQYAALKYAGFLSDEEIGGAMQGDSFLFKHPKMDLRKGFEFSGGSLGQGLGLVAGSALSLRLQGNNKPRFYCLLGDGECDEGSVWEALSFIIQYDLTSVTTIVDRNRLQNDGATEEVLKLGDLRSRFTSMGFDVVEVDGHDVLALQEAFCLETEKPKIVLANTVKGKGVSFAENNVDWHISYFTEELYNQAMEELAR